MDAPHATKIWSKKIHKFIKKVNNMKKIGKKYWLIFGAVVITLFLLSSATATNLLVADKINEKEQKNDVYVDPNIRLTRKHLPFLKEAIKNVDNHEIKKVIVEIINILENTQIIKANDIEKIITNNDMRTAKVYGLASITTEDGEWGGRSGGNLYCLPGNFRSRLFFISKGGVAYWHAYKTDDWLGHYVYPYLKINGDLFDYEHRGLAIGLFGICHKTIGNLPGQFDTFEISGIALLAIII